ncbi:transporter substrate-binding domain-containing protein [Marinomonas sp.]|nr:transporter substrate-binding domain-containing protein [Marinomonas sp.]
MMLNKINLKKVIVFCTACISFYTPLNAATLAEIKERGYMVVATEDNYPPFEYIENGTPKGLDHELLALLRKHATFEIRQQIVPWTGILAGVETGKYDMALTAVSVTKERNKKLEFVMPITEATQFYVKRADDDSINSINDLSGKVAGVQSGGAAFNAVTEDLSATLATSGKKIGKVIQYTSYPEAYQDLAIGRVDYVVNGVVNLATLSNEHPDRFAIGQAVGSPAYAAWALHKGNAELWAYVNSFLAKTRASGEFKKLQEKWIKKSFDDMPLYVTP